MAISRASASPSGRSPGPSRRAAAMPEGATLLCRQRGVQGNWKLIRRFLHRLHGELARTPFTVCIVSGAAIRRLNRQFRHRDAATDVLSFPACASPEQRGAALRAEESEDSLGDIVISAPAAARAARENGWRIEQEIQALALHGLLHLMGYDHEADHGQMARAERRWARKLGLAQTLLTRRYRKTPAKSPERRPNR